MLATQVSAQDKDVAFAINSSGSWGRFGRRTTSSEVVRDAQNGARASIFSWRNLASS